jgi:hypothetical protein
LKGLFASASKDAGRDACAGDTLLAMDAFRASLSLVDEHGTHKHAYASQ